MNLKRKLAAYHYDFHQYRRKVVILYLLHIENMKGVCRAKPRWHIRPLFQERESHGHYHCFTRELQLYNSALYYNFMRMTSSTFEELVILVSPKLQRNPIRKDILSVGEILTATLRYLASGESMVSIMYSFRIGKATITKIIYECCTVLWDTLYKKVLLQPTKSNWIKVAKEFYDQCQMPNCCGALDGKHVVHQAFANSGSTNFNYKGSHSTVLLALCDANYYFTIVDIGSPGRCSDGGIFKECTLGKAILEKKIDFPEPKEIDTVNGKIPYFIIADEAFPLMENIEENIMRPYPGRGKAHLPIRESVFNYRLSRARRVIENTFGILASKWRIYRRPIIAGEKTVNAIIKATVVLHNFIKRSEDRKGINSYSSNSDYQNNESGALQIIRPMGSNNNCQDARNIREKLSNYFLGEGALEFQYDRS